MRQFIAAILAVSILLAGSAGTEAATRTNIAAPLHLGSLHMVDALNGWAQNGNAVFRTTNGGQNWTDVTPGGVRQASNPLPMPGAYFLSATRAWLAVTAGRDLYNGRITVYRTADGGLHWQAAGVPVTGVATLNFANSRDGWQFVTKGPGAGQNPYILLRSVDGGAHWRVVAQSTPTRQTRGSFPGCNCTGAVTFRNARTGWSTGTQFALPISDWLWVSHDGGYTWQHQALPIPHGFIVYYTSAPVFSGQQGGAFLAELMTSKGSQSQVYALYITRDGGATWSRGALVSPQGNGAISSSIADSTHAWVSDGRRLYRTVDGGRHWTALFPQVPAFARAFWTNRKITASSPDTTIDFVSGTTGFAYDPQQHATRPYILKTVDGGVTWQAIYPLSGSVPLHR